MEDYVKAVQFEYGISKKDAEKFVHIAKKNGNGGKQRLDIILNSFEDNARKSFYED